MPVVNSAKGDRKKQMEHFFFRKIFSRPALRYIIESHSLVQRVGERRKRKRKREREREREK